MDVKNITSLMWINNIYFQNFKFKSLISILKKNKFDMYKIKYNKTTFTNQKLFSSLPFWIIRQKKKIFFFGVNFDKIMKK
jgi:hypothetical protein